MGVEALDAGSRAADAARRAAGRHGRGHAARRARRRTGGGRRRSSAGSIAASAARTPPAASSWLTAAHLVGPDQPVAGRHRGAVVEQRRVAHHDRVAVVVADDDLEVALRLAAEELADRAPRSSIGRQRRRREQQEHDAAARAPTGPRRFSIAGPAMPARSIGSVAGPLMMRFVGAVAPRLRCPPTRSSSARGGGGRRVGCGVGRLGGTSDAGRRRSPAVGAVLSSAVLVEHRVEVAGELLHQLLADVAHDAAAELGHLAGDVEVGRDGALGARRRQRLGLGGDVGGGVAPARRCRGLRPSASPGGSRRHARRTGPGP